MANFKMVCGDCGSNTVEIKVDVNHNVYAVCRSCPTMSIEQIAADAIWDIATVKPRSWLITDWLYSETEKRLIGYRIVSDDEPLETKDIDIETFKKLKVAGRLDDHPNTLTSMQVNIITLKLNNKQFDEVE